MEIVPVGDTNRLFHITDVLPDNLFKDLLQVAWDTVPVPDDQFRITSYSLLGVYSQ